MKSQGKVWIFFDKITNEKTKPLGLAHAQAQVLEFQGQDLSQFLVWTPGWAKWVPLDQYLNSSQKYFMLLPDLSEVTHASSVDEETSRINLARDVADFSAEHINIKLKSKDVARREMEPPNCQLRVTLISRKGKTFKTSADFISNQGMRLCEDIPSDFLNSPFNVILNNPTSQKPEQKRVLVDGQIIGDMSDNKHLSFLNLEADTQKIISGILSSFQAELTKKTSA
jgi:hypothetical protein